jgi:predicted Ser/Thr protein kinase
MEQIGRYKITGELGRGAMGIVYRALDPAIGRTVAIKVIRLNEFTDPSERTRLRDRLFREAQSAGVLSHPNIVTIYDIDEAAFGAYIAMEFVDGPTLDHMLTADPPDGALMLSILRQTAAALDYAHSRGIIHRDIKPANVMIHERNSAKITDFGVARIQSQQMTQAGMMIGTPNYMSPEQIQGRPVDGRSDQFSLAVIAYELLTGERPFAGNSLATVVFKIMNEEPLPIQRLNPTLGWAAETVLKKALAKNPADRYATCAEFVAALDKACAANPTWKPLKPGTSTELPTVMEETRPPATLPPTVPIAPPAPAEPPKPAVDARPMPARIEEDEAAPALAGGARKVALLVLLAALVGGGVWAYRHFAAAPPTSPSTAENVTPPAPAETGAVKAPPAPQPRTPPETSQQQAKPSPLPATPPKEPAAAKPREQAPAQPSTVDVHFITTPTGAAISTDGGQTCTTPCDLTLPSGRYSIAANLDGYRRALRVLETAKEHEVVLTLEKSMGTLAVKSTPAGATISIDGKDQGRTTPAMLQLPAGKYKLRVSKEGVSPYTEDVEVKDSVITNVDVNWGSR